MKAGRREVKTGRQGTASPGFPVITLLTDFGTADYFVAALKGVILSLNPSVAIADITHDIPPQDVEAAAFTLLASYPTFPAKTIHVAVVDPGVGSARRPIIVSAGSQVFVGPDNGIFSYIYENEPSHQTLHVTAEKYFRHPVSETFHGRDVFAPVAAALSNGLRPEVLGPQINDAVRLELPLEPVALKNGNVKGRIIHVDRFGNCITNIPRRTLSAKDESRARLLVKGKTVKSFRTFFSDDEVTGEKVFGIWGSAGFLEIAAQNRSAAEMLNVKRGDAVILRRR